MGADFDLSWARIAATATAIVMTGQERIAEQAAQYIPEVLEDTGQVRSIDAVAEVNPKALVGTTASGVAIDDALFGAVIASKIAIGDGATVAGALKSGADRLTRTAGTILSDTGRGGERLGMAVRPVAGYVRMLVPPSCSRCVLLAGKFYWSSTAFKRHPKCDCRHIPSSESSADDFTVHPGEYFDSLPRTEQDRIFTKAGAEAIRNGADISQVVNARRGMSSTADALGRKRLSRNDDGLFTTNSGTTRRGWYGGYTKLGRSRSSRLMPEQIQEMAGSKDEYLRLLKNYGYIL